MKVLLQILTITTIFFACNNNDSHNKSIKGVLHNTSTCSFEMPSSLFLNPVDTNQFVKDTYFYFASDSSENVMQLFVFDSLIDLKEKIQDQIETFNTPDVFKTIQKDTIKKLCNVAGQGTTLKGIYSGGIVRGTINIFGFSQNAHKALIIRQTVGGNQFDATEFDEVINTLKLK